MLKTLLHLSELYFSLPGSVILIDEFENSLGVNCLDAVTEDINDSPNQLQFIITSHHLVSAKFSVRHFDKMPKSLALKAFQRL
jgi:AAA15 family ATPase/GTPase